MGIGSRLIVGLVRFFEWDRGRNTASSVRTFDDGDLPDVDQLVVFRPGRVAKTPASSLEFHQVMSQRFAHLVLPPLLSHPYSYQSIFSTI